MIRIPPTIEAAQKRLGSLDGLITAREWERAAIISAFVETNEGRGTRTDRRRGNFAKLTPSEFATLGINGLRSPHTVRHYAEAWAEYGTGDVRPGNQVELPDVEWPPNPTVGRSIDDDDRRNRLMEAGREAGLPKGSKVVDVAANPTAVRAAIKADPRLADVARKALAERDREQISQEHPEGRELPAGPKPPKRDYDHDVDRGVNLIIVALAAKREGLWTPTPLTEAELYFLSRALTDQEMPAGNFDEALTKLEAYANQEIR